MIVQPSFLLLLLSEGDRSSLETPVFLGFVDQLKEAKEGVEKENTALRKADIAQVVTFNSTLRLAM